MRSNTTPSPQPRGRDTRPLAEDELTGEQKDAVARFHVLLAQHSEGSAGAVSGARSTACGSDAEDPFVTADTFEPDPRHRVILFDGKRGTGKTATMLAALQTLVGDRPRGHAHVRHLALTPVSFDEIPDDTHAFAFLATAVGRVVDWVTKLDGNPTAHERRALRERYKTLCTTTLGWLRPGGGDRSLADFVAEQLEADRGWHGLRGNWCAFIELLLARLESTGRLCGGGLLLVPIDDLDLQPGRARELLLAFRMISHPRLIYVLTGDSEHLAELLGWEVEGELRRRTGLGELDHPALRDQAKRLAEAQLLKSIPPATRLRFEMWSLEQFFSSTELQLGLRLSRSSNTTETLAERWTEHGGFSDADGTKHQCAAAALLCKRVRNPSRARHGLTARRATAIWQQLEALTPEQHDSEEQWLAVVFALLAEDWHVHGEPRLEADDDGRASRAVPSPALDSRQSGLFVRPPLVWRAPSAEGTRGQRLDEIGQFLAEASLRGIRPRPKLGNRELDPKLLRIASPREVFANSAVIRAVVDEALPVPAGLEGRLASAFANRRDPLDAAAICEAMASDGIALAEPGAIASSEHAVRIGDAAARAAGGRAAAVEPHLLLWLAAPESGLDAGVRRDIALGWQLRDSSPERNAAALRTFAAAARLRQAHLSAEVGRLRGTTLDGEVSAEGLDVEDARANGRGVWPSLTQLPGPSILQWTTRLGLALGSLFRSRETWAPHAAPQTLPEWLGFSANDASIAPAPELEALGRTLLMADSTRDRAFAFIEDLAVRLQGWQGRSVADELLALEVGLKSAAGGNGSEWNFGLNDQGELEVFSRNSQRPVVVEVVPDQQTRFEADIGGCTVSLPQGFVPRLAGITGESVADRLLLLAFDLQRARDAARPGVSFGDEQALLAEGSGKRQKRIRWPRDLSYREALMLSSSLRAYCERQNEAPITNPLVDRRRLLIAVVQFCAAILGARVTPQILALERTSHNLLEAWRNGLHQGKIDSPEHRFGKWLREAGFETFLAGDPEFLDAFVKRPNNR